jgi:hypothetical protein
MDQFFMGIDKHSFLFSTISLINVISNLINLVYCNLYKCYFLRFFNSYLTSYGQNVRLWTKRPILDILDIVVLTLEIGIKVCDFWNYDLI